MFPESADSPNPTELRLEAAEARVLASQLGDDPAIADLIAYASMLEAATPQLH